MAIPSVNITISNRSLGQQPPSPGDVTAVFGPCTGLAADEIRELSGSVQSVIDAAGYGPGADLAANLVAGGSTVILTSVAYTPATPSAVTHTGTGTTVMTVTGSPFDRYDCTVEVLRAGTSQSTPAPGFRVSFDAGATWTREIRVPVSGSYAGLADVTGLTLEFDAGTMVVGDVYEFSVDAPTVAASAVTDAIDAFRVSDNEAAIFYVTGEFERADVVTIQNSAGQVINTKRFLRLMVESRDSDPGETESDWIDSLDADFQGYASDITVVNAGYAPVSSAALGFRFWRSIGWTAIVRTVETGLSRDLGAVEDGALVSYVGSANVDKSSGVPTGKFVHDEYLVGGLDSSQFLTIRSFPGLPGYYVTNPNIMSGPVSDFEYLQLGRVMDEAARLTNIYFTQRLNTDVLLNPQTGKILEKEAKKLEQGNDEACRSLVDEQDVSALRTIVSRDDDIPATQTLTVTVQLVPKGYLKQINVTMEFVPSFS